MAMNNTPAPSIIPNVVLVRNPFDRTNKDSLFIEIDGNTTVETLISASFPIEAEVSAAIDGVVITRDEWGSRSLRQGEQLIVIPVLQGGGNGALRMLAFLALAVFAAPMAGYLLTGTFAWVPGIAAGLLTMGISVVGGMLINALLPPPKSNLTSPDASQTYSWSPQTTQQAGIPIARTYGKLRLHGNLISTYIENTGTNEQTQVQHLLIDFGTGPFRSISDVRINDQSVSDYTDVTVETRMGLLSQGAINGFEDTFIQESVSKKVVNGTPVVHAIGAGVDALEIGFTFPNGLWFSDKGSIVNYTVRIKVEYSSDDGNSWIEVSENDGSAVQSEQSDSFWNYVPVMYSSYRYGSSGVEITASSTNPVRHTFKVKNLNRGLAYKIRLSNQTPDTTDSDYGDDCYLTSVSKIVYDDFAYPGTALLGIRAVATDQLSGSIDISARCEGQLVWVYRDSAWHFEWSNNPAWVAFDVLTQPVVEFNAETEAWTTLEYEGLNPSRLVLPDFVNFSTWCDELVPDGNGGTEKRCCFDGQFDTQTNIWDAVLEVLGTALAVPAPIGTKIGLVWDRQQTIPIQVFTVGNTKTGGFTEKWLPMEDRVSQLEVDFINADLDYVRDKMSCVNEQMELDGKYQPASFSGRGMVRPSQIYRIMQRRLEKNRLVKRSGSIDVDVDAIACRAGDLVWVQADVPAWGCGGRLVAATVDTVTLDQEVTLISGKSYQVIVRLGDDSIIARSVMDLEGTYTTLTLSGAVSPIPQKYDVFAFGEVGRAVKPFLVTDMNRKSDFTMSLSLIEYVDTTSVDFGNPVIPPSNISTALVEFLSFGISESIRLSGNQIFMDVCVNFEATNPAQIKRYLVYVAGPSGAWALITESTASPMVIPNRCIGESISIKIEARGFAGELQSTAEINHIIAGTLPKPMSPFDLVGTWTPALQLSGDYILGLYVNWSASPSGNVSEYELSWRIAGSNTWESVKTASLGVTIPALSVNYDYEIMARAISDIFMPSDWIGITVNQMQSAWAATYSDTVPVPLSPTVYASPDSNGNVSKAKVVVKFPSTLAQRVNGLAIFVSSFPYENAVSIESGGTSGNLTISNLSVISQGTLSVLAGSTPNSIVTTTYATPLDTTYNLAGRYWARLPGGSWRKCTGIDAVSYLFAQGHDVSPTEGQALEWVELGWADERTGDTKLAILVSGSAYEIIEWDGMDTGGVGGAARITGCTRGVEGTTPINADGKKISYLPAPGAGTTMIDFPVSVFTEVDGAFVGESNISLNIPPGNFATLSAGVYVTRPDGGYYRSALVPATFGGPL